MITILINNIGEIDTKRSFAHLDRSIIHVDTNDQTEALTRCANWFTTELTNAGEDAKALEATPEGTILIVARGREEFMHIVCLTVCPVHTIS